MSALVAIFSCGALRPAFAAPPIRVVATVFPLADIVQQIGGSAVSVTTLLPAGASPHTYEPTPQQVRLCQEARLFVRVGAGLDDWLDRLLAGVASASAEVVTATAGAALLDEAEHGGRGDPHVWLDPRWVRQHLLPRLEAALRRAGADQDAALAAGAARYAEELERLDQEIAAAAKGWGRPDFVAVHQAWRYFARRYGLRQVGAIEESPGKEPSARTIARLVDAARAGGSRSLLVEPQLSQRIAATIAAEFGGGLVLVDPLGGQGIPDRDSYLSLMRFNARAFGHACQ